MLVILLPVHVYNVPFIYLVRHTSSQLVCVFYNIYSHGYAAVLEHSIQFFH